MAKYGEANKQLVINILEKKRHPEQAYKSCMRVLSFEKKVGRDRLNRTCERASEFNIHKYKTDQNILESGLDQINHDKENDKTLSDHYNTMGKRYYQ